MVQCSQIFQDVKSQYLSVGMVENRNPTVRTQRNDASDFPCLDLFDLFERYALLLDGTPTAGGRGDQLRTGGCIDHGQGCRIQGLVAVAASANCAVHRRHPADDAAEKLEGG